MDRMEELGLNTKKTDEQRKLEYSYRQVFGTEHGRIVLKHILGLCGFYGFRNYDSQEAMIAGATAENLAKKILYHFGVWKPENFERIPFFYPDRVLDLPYIESGEENNE